MTRFDIKKRILILLGIFLAALALFFFLRQNKTVVYEEVYSSSMPDAQLPVVWTVMCGREMNCMRGHLSDVNSDVAYDTLTLIPEDRHLVLHMIHGGVYVIGARLEVRSGDLKELIENTEITELEKSEEGITMTLPLQNLLLPEREYRLDLTLTTAEKGDIHYYTRIRMTEDMTLPTEMLDLVTEFSNRNFNYDEARDNTMYVETDGSADDTQLAYTNLKSTFTNLAFNNMKLSPVGNKDLRLSVYDGNMGEIEQCYIVSRDTVGGRREYYEVSETYTLRMGAIRIHMLNFSRRMREIFTGADSLSGRRVILGINSEDDIQAVSSGNDAYTYFVTTRDLWCFSKENHQLKCIFSFREEDQTGMMNTYDRHNTRILRVAENGDMQFIVYGYMNRGEHEGETGIAYMSYFTEPDEVKEEFFIPIGQNYEAIESDVQELAYLGENNMLYLKISDAFYAIDVMSGSYIILSDKMQEGSYAISRMKEKIAWQEENRDLEDSVIHIMNLNTGQKQELRSEEGFQLCPQGFIGRDIVVSIHDYKDAWYINDRFLEIPANAIEIVDDNLVVLKRYEKPGMYLTDINVHDGRVSMNIMRKTTIESYQQDSQDTIVSSIEQPARRENIGSYQTDDRLQIFYLELPEDVSRSSVQVAKGTGIVGGGAVIEGITVGEDNKFSAYADGKMTANSSSLSKAVEAAYPGMGTVRYHGHVVYSRPGTVNTRVIGDYLERAERMPAMYEAGELLSLRGISLRQALFYVSSKALVLGFKENGTPLMIYAYDRTTISCYNLQTNSREYYGMDEAEEMFARGKHDFLCDFTLD